MSDHNKLGEHDIALINRVVDRALSAAEQSQVDLLLAGSEAARNLHAELTSVVDYLDHAPQLDPPDHLLNSILSNIKLPPAQTAKANPGSWRIWTALRPLPTAAAMAATALIVAGIYQVGFDGLNEEDNANMVGTLIGSPVGHERKLVDSVQVDTEELQAVVELSREEDLLILEVKLASGLPPGFEMTFSGDDLDNGTLKFEGLVHPAKNKTPYSTTKQSAIASDTDSQVDAYSYQFTYSNGALGGNNPSSAPLTLQFHVDGSTVYETNLSTSGQNK